VARARRRLALAPSHRLRVIAVTIDRPRQAAQDERRLVLERDDPGGRGVVLPEAGPEVDQVGPDLAHEGQQAVDLALDPGQDLGIPRRGMGQIPDKSTSMSTTKLAINEWAC
jgi:hypothetical protein